MGINVVGLGIALCAALFIALIVRVESTYDRFFPDHERIYRVNSVSSPPGEATRYTGGVVPAVAQWLREDFTSIEAAGRFISQQVSIRRGDVEAAQGVLWADPDTLRVLTFPAVAGDVASALDQPDGIVLTRRVARQFFGRDDPIGETLEIDRQHPMRVTAVIEDLPESTHLDVAVIASGLAKFSRMAQVDSAPGQVIAQIASTYIKLRPDVSAEALSDAFPEMLIRHGHGPRLLPDGRRARADSGLNIVPLADIHLSEEAGGGMRPQGSVQLLVALASIGGLIVLTAGFNYVNLMTARATRRAVEVGVRKAFGARRRELIGQFMRESMVYVAAAAVLAVVLFFILRKPVNGLLAADIPPDIWKDPMLVLACLGAVLVIGVLAAAYPAFVLSSFRPAIVMRGGLVANASSGVLRQVFIGIQLAVLMGLMLGTTFVYRQGRFAVSEALRVDEDPVLTIRFTMGPCKATLVEEIRALPGVQATACTLGAPFGSSISMNMMTPRNEPVQLYQHHVDFDFFEIYGIKPVAGRVFSRAHGPADSAPTDSLAEREARLVMNETAARRYGYRTPQEAIGQFIQWQRIVSLEGRFSRPAPAEVIGVVPDFPLGNITNRIDPAVFFIDPSLSGIIHVKLDRRQPIERTLARIDGLWKALGDPRPISRQFVDQLLQERYASLTRQARVFGAFSGVALFVGCLGLFGLSAFATERRTKEVGIRKALGANRADIARFFLWEFTKPVLGAAIVAIPVAYLALRHWLDGFSFRVDLSPGPFAAAALATWLIACSTVLFHVLRAARSRPVEALRYE